MKTSIGLTIGRLRSLHWKQGHTKLDLMVQDLKDYIPPPEEKIRKHSAQGEESTQITPTHIIDLNA